MISEKYFEGFLLRESINVIPSRTNKKYKFYDCQFTSDIDINVSRKRLTFSYNLNRIVSQL